MAHLAHSVAHEVTALTSVFHKRLFLQENPHRRRRRHAVVLSCFSSAVSEDLVKDEKLRDDLRFYFMNPCEKYRARQHVPWKLGVQILKVVMVTTQVCSLGSD